MIEAFIIGCVAVLAGCKIFDLITVVTTSDMKKIETILFLTGAKYVKIQRMDSMWRIQMLVDGCYQTVFLFTSKGKLIKE